MIIDASAAVALLVDVPLQAANTVRRRLVSAAAAVFAPHLLDLEVAQVLRRLAFSGALTAERADAALEDFADLEIGRYPHTPFLPRVWQLRHNLTAYDAMYIALAEALDAPLLTLDARLQSAPGHAARIELVS